MKNKNLKVLFTLLISSIALTCCVEKLNFDDADTTITLQSALAIPIGNVHVNAMDLISIVDTTYLKSDTCNGVYVCYKQDQMPMNFNIDEYKNGETLNEILTLRTVEELQDVFEILDKLGLKEAPLPVGSYEFQQSTLYHFGFNEYIEGEKDIHVDSAIVNHAEINFNLDVEGVELNENTYLELSFHFPDLLDEKDANRFENIKITENSYRYHNEMDHFKAHFDITESDSNAVDLVVDFKIVSDGSSKISTDAKLNFQTDIRLMKFDEIYGHVWQKAPYRGDNVKFDIPTDIFQNELFKNNNILFSNPQLGITLHSNIGVPLLVCIDRFHYTKNNERHTLECGESCRFEMEQPKWEGENHMTYFKIDKTNSPIAELLNAFPEKVEIDWTVYANDSVREHVHYFLNPIIAEMDFDITLPFQFEKETSISYKDTLAMDVSAILGEEGILNMVGLDTMNLYLDVNSMLPANVSVKLFYLDEMDSVIFESKTFSIPSAIVDETGRATEATKETIVLSTNGENIEDVYNTKKIMFEISISGNDETSRIYFQSTDAIDINLSAFIKANPTIDLSVNDSIEE